jgi:hypothetical protein
MVTIHGFGDVASPTTDASATGDDARPALVLPPGLAAERRARMLRLDPMRVEDEIGSALETIQSLTRRSTLKVGALAATAALLGPLAGLLAPKAEAGDPVADPARRADQFVFPRLQFTVRDNTPDRWDVGPSGDVILRRKLREMTNVDISMDPKVVRLNDFDDMCRNPYVFMTSEGDFGLPEREEANLREFMVRGGFIHSDDCVFNGDPDRYFRCYCKLMDKLFPGNPMRKIPLDHELYRIFFKFPNGCPHMQGVNHGAFGLFEPGTGRLMSIATPGDLHCGWMCRFWKEEKNMEAVKMGLNIIIYYLTH